MIRLLFAFNVLFGMYAGCLLVVTPLNIYASVKSYVSINTYSHIQPDTNIIVPIVYPPLTDREGKGMNIYKPPLEHPRLYLTKNYIPLLKQKAAHPLLKDCWSRIIKAASFNTDGYLPLEGVKENNNRSVRDAIEAKALLFVMTNNEPSGRAAISAVLNYLATIQFNLEKQDVTREIGRAIVTGSMVYDWCYPLLSDLQKKVLIGRMETMASQMEIKWPDIRDGSITSHTVEAQLSRDMLSLAIATYNEKPVIYDRVAGRIFAEFVPSRQFFYPGAYHHQGSAYGAYRFTWDIYATFLFDRMGYPDLYGKNQNKVPYYFIYARRPDGQMFRDGDDYSEQYNPFGKWWPLGQNMFLLAGSYHKDPLVIREGLKEGKPGTGADYIFDFLFTDINILEKDTRADLPLTRYFQEPQGEMIARTGWEDGITSPDVIAKMKVQVYNFSNHQHLDAGSFQLYYKGPLAVQSGIYQGKNGAYGGDHFKNYSQRTISSNSILVYNPEEKFTWHRRPVVNDGGQRFPNDAHEPMNMSELLEQGYKTGEVLAHVVGPDAVKPEFSYLKGELAKAYTEKVKSFKRSFVFLNLLNDSIPAALIVFDKVISSDKNFKKTWLLHCVEEPFVQGAHTTIQRTEKGYDGKMINTTLIPAGDNLLIEKIGGEGREYEVESRNFPQSMNDPEGSSGDSAVWRIEVSPKEPLTENLFLNVMQVMDKTKKNTNTDLAKKIETVFFTGTSLQDRIVLFSKTGELIKETFDLDIEKNETVKVLITDVAKGNWKMEYRDRKDKAPLVLDGKDGILYFKAAKGKYRFIKQ